MTSNADTSDVIGDGSSRKNSGTALHSFNLHLALLQQFITKSHPSDNCLWLFFPLETIDGITFSAIIFKLPVCHLQPEKFQFALEHEETSQKR